MAPSDEHIDETNWWFQAAERAFAVLESDLGFEIVERHYHFHGNYIVYERSDARFAVEAGSDWNSLGGTLWLGPARHRRGRPIEDALATVEPVTEWRYNGSSGPIDRAAMVAKMDQWAAGIIAHLPALVAREEA